MAEARSAVEFSGQHKRGIDLMIQPDGSLILSIRIPHPNTARVAVGRLCYRWRNWLLDNLWPASPILLVLVVSTIVWVVLHAPEDSWFRSGWLAYFLWRLNSMFPLVEGQSVSFRVGYLAAFAAFWIFMLIMVIHRAILRILLSWMGWIDRRTKNSWKTKLWVAGVKFFCGAGVGQRGLLYAYQAALPHLPVPTLEDTVRKYLLSVEPLFTKKKFARVKKIALKFAKEDGQELQRYLQLKSWFWSSNYVTDWWEKYVYLRSRKPIAVNSNYYILDFCEYCPAVEEGFDPAKIQTRRAAVLASLMYNFKQKLENESLEPMRMRSLVPICMAQYERMFGTCRTPGREFDAIRTSQTSTHIIAARHGFFYRIDLKLAVSEDPIPLDALEKLLIDIKADADRLHANRGKRHPSQNIAALTAIDRCDWAQAREDYFSEGINRASLREIERALFILWLDENSPSKWSERGTLLMHGDGTNRWFDKSFQLIVFENGFAGLNAEHSWADAPIPAHLWEFVLCHEVAGKERYYAAEPKKSLSPDKEFVPIKTQSLQFELPAEAITLVDKATSFARHALDDLHLEIMGHREYGKDFVKAQMCSPDAWIQQALQLASYRDAGGRFMQTYEASMTRLFELGRTETVRSLSKEAVAFVRSMENPASTMQEREDALRKACQRHQDLCGEAMSGRGIDRHLFALKVVSLGYDTSSDFLKEALEVPWRLSTSQQPQRQTDVWDLLPANFIETHCTSPGGGFGPVGDDGYGISYMAVNSAFFFHISSKKSSSETDSLRMSKLIKQALADMHAIFAKKEKVY